jgi:CarD family transcriptional regulator
MSSNLKFKEGTQVVYPSHGVGVIQGVETKEVVGTEIKTYVINFSEAKMTLSVPVSKAHKSGLRELSDESELDKVNKILTLRPKSSRGMWSRRAKEYETKINSGNIVSVAEVVRDLHKNVDDPDRSYSERIIYENALERLAREISAIKKVDIENAQSYVVKNINEKNPYFIKKAKEEAERKAEELAKLKEKEEAEKSSKPKSKRNAEIEEEEVLAA